MGRCGKNKARYPPSRPTTPLPPSEKKFGPLMINALLASVEADAEACSLLAVATTPTTQEKFCLHLVTKHIKKFKGFRQSQLPRGLFHHFTSWAGQIQSRKIPAHRIPAALSYRTKEKETTWWSKQHFIETTGLNWKAVDKGAFLSTLTPYFVKARPAKQPYPPPDILMAETRAIKKINRKFFYVDPLHDTRDKRRPIHQLKTSELRLDIGPDESAIIYDEDKKELVGMVIRNVCKNQDAVNFVDAAVEKTIATRSTCRASPLLLIFNQCSTYFLQKGDAGSLPQIGLSAGSRNAMCLDWVKNLKSKATPKDAQDEANKEMSSACALFWNLARSVVPDEVIKDFDEHLQSLKIRRMDGGGTMPHDIKTGLGDYPVEIPGYKFTFHGAQLAPPTGVCALNYSRHTHKEKQPHEYAISWTTSRDIDPQASPVHNGGHFFLASHAVRIQAAANSLIVWRPSLWHGTSLSLQDPRKPFTGFSQRGLAFVTSSRLPSAWQKYQDNLLSKEEAESLLLGHEPDSEELEVLEQGFPSDSDSDQALSPMSMSSLPRRSGMLLDTSLAQPHSGNTNGMADDSLANHNRKRSSRLPERYRNNFAKTDHRLKSLPK